MTFLTAAILFSGNAFSQCTGTQSFTASPLPFSGNVYPPGTVVTFCYTMSGFTEIAANWIDGFNLTIGSGWNAGSLTPVSTPSNCAAGGGQWLWRNSVTGQFSGATWGPGYFFDLDMDGNPGNDYGDENASNCTWTFCFTLTVGNTPGASLALGVQALSDGQAGSWGSTACSGFPFTLSTSTVANSPGTVLVTQNSALCNGQSVTLFAAGAGSYTWSPATGLSSTTGTTVTATPTTTTTYTVTGTGGCATCTASTTVTVNPLPTVSISPPSPGVCAGQGVALTASGASTYAWSPTTNLSAPTGATVTANPPVETTYTVTGTTAAGCTGTATTTVVMLTGLNISVSPASASICTGESVVLTASGGTTYTWLPNSGLSSSSGASVTASPPITRTYTVTGHGPGGCTGTATVTVTVSNPPNATLTPATSTICNGASVVLTAGGASSYSWSPAAGLSATTGASVTASPSSTTTYTLSAANAAGCTVTRTAIITVNPSPVVTINPPTDEICAGGFVNLTASGATSYTWLPATDLSATTGGSVTADPTTTTTYTVTGSDGGACTGSASVTITVNPLPTVTVSPPAPSVCTNGSIVLTGNGALTYAWSPAAGLSATSGTTVTATPAATGNYLLTGTDANGCSAWEAFVLAVTSSAQVNIIGTEPSCNAGSNGSALAIPLSGSPPFSYAWSDGQTTNPATGLSAGNIGLTITDGAGCTGTANAIITEPSVLGSSVTFPGGATISCNGGNDGSASLNVTGGTTPYSFAWSNGATTQTLTDVAAGTYTVIITDANNCTTTNSATFTEPPAITLALNSPLLANGYNTSCAGYSDGVVTSSVSNGQTPFTYLWSNGATIQNISNAAAGTNSLTITDANGCTGTNSVVLTDPPGTSASMSSFSDASCNGFNDGTATVNASGGYSPYTYAWNSGQTTAAVTDLAAGIHTVVITDASGCTTTESITISQPMPLSASVSASAAICIGQTGTLTATPAGGTHGYTFSWASSPADASLNTADQNPVVSPAVTTMYTLNITDANGCTLLADPVTVAVNPALAVTLSTAVPAGVCPGKSISITCIASGGSGVYSCSVNGTPVSYGTTYTAQPASSGDYVFTVTDDCGSPPAIASVFIEVYPLPVIDFTADIISGCEPQTVHFTDHTLPAPVASAWNFGDYTLSTIIPSSDPTHTYANAGSYDVTHIATTAHGCIDSLTIPGMIQVYPPPAADFSLTPPVVNLLEALVTFNDQSSGANSWSWDFGDSTYSDLENPQHYYSDTGTFIVWLTAISVHGCKDSVQSQVRVTPDFMIYVPSAFTPDANGLNDGFRIYGEGIKKDGFEFRVFNRWGEEVFSTFDVNGQWTGDFNGNGKIVPPGVYVYTVLLKDNHNRIKFFKGHLNVLR